MSLIEYLIQSYVFLLNSNLMKNLASLTTFNTIYRLFNIGVHFLGHTAEMWHSIFTTSDHCLHNRRPCQIHSLWQWYRN